MQNQHNISPKILSQFKQKLKQRKCFYPNCDTSKTIKAHSIQENGPLIYLADEINGQNHVYCLDDEFDMDEVSKTMVSKIKVKRTLDSKGIGVASTFNNFCEKHDAIFKTTIEDVKYEKSLSQLFHHSYRAYAYSMHKTYQYHQLILNLGKEAKNELNALSSQKINSPNGLFKELFDSIDSVIENANNAINGLSSVFGLVEKEMDKLLFGEILKKGHLDEAIEKSNFNKLIYFQKSIKGLFPIACSCAIHYLDNIAEMSSDEVAYAAEIAITVFPDKENNQTQFILGSFKENANSKLLFSRLNIMEDSTFLKFISDLIIHRGHNVYLSPRMVKNMTSQEVDEIINQRCKTNSYDIGLPKININLFDKKYKEENRS